MVLLKNKLIKEIDIRDFRKVATDKIGSVNGVQTKRIKNGFIFVGASWCGYCKSFAPEIDKLANITGLNYPVSFVDGNKDSNNQLLNLLKVSGFPTIFIVYNYKLYKYEGQRNIENIIAEMCRISDRNVCFA